MRVFVYESTRQTAARVTTLLDLVFYRDQRAAERGADGLGIFPSLSLLKTAGEVKQETLPTQSMYNTVKC